MADISKSEKVQLHTPPLEELRGGKDLSFDTGACLWNRLSLKKEWQLLLVSVLQAGLEDNFAEVQVSVVECPDLTKEPFHFPVKGESSHCMHVTQYSHTGYIFKKPIEVITSVKM